MDLCLMHANCQGEPLAKLLAVSPEFSKRWQIQLVFNYTSEPVSDEALRACTLFLYQNLGAQWGDLSSASLLGRLNPAARAVCLPNPFFTGYWPFWTGQSRMNFGDKCLDYLVDQGLDPAEAVHLYMKDSFVARHDPDALLAESQAVERHREAGAVIEVVAYVEAHWKEEQLFTTVNHPAPVLTRLIANAVLEDLGLPELPELAQLPLSLADLSCDTNFELPIHPAVGRHFGLPFADEHRTYPAYGQRLTFRQYALAYADCRKKGLNLHHYLQGAVE